MYIYNMYAYTYRRYGHGNIVMVSQGPTLNWTALAFEVYFFLAYLMEHLKTSINIQIFDN